MSVVQFVVATVTVSLVGGTLASLSRHSHWFVRGWDFPRIQILVLLALCAGASWLVFDGPTRLVLAGASGLALGWQGSRILPYTKLMPVQVEPAGNDPGVASVRILVSNVQMENRQYARWLTTITQAKPDIVICLETNDVWQAQVATLTPTMPHVIEHVRDNYYGMMVLSRLPLVEPRVRFLVSDDVPSIHTGVALPDGSSFALHVLHPRPPEPVQHQSSAERDGELLQLARELQRDSGPAVVAGDLNDVAWSDTTRLFQRISGLLDPRIGRGFFNTFDANHWIMRWPLDHVFHTEHFELVGLQRLGHVGSDHFPILVELTFVPGAGVTERAPAEPDEADEERAEEAVERAKQEAEP